MRKTSESIIRALVGTKSTSDELPESLREHPDNYLTLRNRFIRRATNNSTLTLLLSCASIVLAGYAVYKTTTTQKNAVEATTSTQLQAVQITTETQRKLTELTLKQQRDLKEIDLRQSFQKRYDDLTDNTKSLVKTRQDAEAY